ncbi:MAG: hypothetical protein K6E98_07480 [Lachnospiraceae bacterium]|nr:hypothetical protein [Lachnospiraceae bacterium]
MRTTIIFLVILYSVLPTGDEVETVALLSKLSEAKHHIEVKVDMDEVDLTSAELRQLIRKYRTA